MNHVVALSYWRRLRTRTRRRSFEQRQPAAFGLQSVAANLSAPRVAKHARDVELGYRKHMHR